MFIENKNKEKKKLTLGKIAAAPFIGTARLFTAPFVLPYKVGKNIVNAVQYAHGDPSNKRTFEEWYVIKNSNEGILQTNYRKCASIALLTLMLTCVALFFGFSFMTRADLTIPLRMVPFVAALVGFAGYFNLIVNAYCLKARAFENKLNVFKSVEDIIPNPFYEFTSCVKDKNNKSRNVPVMFYPKNKK